MSDNSTPQGTDLYSAQNAIRSMLTPQEDNVATEDALEANAAQAEEAEMLDDQEDGYVFWFRIVQIHKNNRKLVELEEYKREMLRNGI